LSIYIRGSFAQVKKAIRKKTGEEVAVKIFNREESLIIFLEPVWGKMMNLL
jgi:hypothetical protein